MVLLLELNIDVTDHVIGEVITNIKVLDLAKFAEFFKNILIEIFEMLLDLVWIEWLALSIDTGSNHVRAVVRVG